MIRRTASVNADPAESGAVSRNACAVRSCQATSDVRSVALHRPGRAPEYHDLCFTHREEARAEGLLTPPPIVKLLVGRNAPKGTESSTKAQRAPQGARPANKHSAVAAPVAAPAPAPAVCPWPGCKSSPTGRGLCSTHLSRAQNLQRPLPFPDTVEGVIEQIPVWLDLWNGRLSAGPPPAVFITTPKEHRARQPRPVQAEPDPMPTTTPAPELALVLAPEAPEPDPTPTQAEPEAPAPVEAHQEINEPDAETDDGDDAPTPVDVARPKPAAPTKAKKEPKGKKPPTRQRKRRADKPLCVWGCGSPAKTCGLCNRDAHRVTEVTGLRPGEIPDLASRIEEFKAGWDELRAQRRAAKAEAFRQTYRVLRDKRQTAQAQPEAAQGAAPPAQAEGAAPTSQAVVVVDAELGLPFLLLDLEEGASEPQVEAVAFALWGKADAPDLQTLVPAPGSVQDRFVTSDAPLSTPDEDTGEPHPPAEASASAPTENSPTATADRPSTLCWVDGVEWSRREFPPAAPISVVPPTPSHDNLFVEGGGDDILDLSGCTTDWVRCEDAPDPHVILVTPNGAIKPSVTIEPSAQPPERAPAPPRIPSQINHYAKAIITRLKLGEPPAHLTGMLAMLERAVLDARHQAERAELQAEERIIEALSRGLFADPERRREAVRWLALRTIPTPAGKADLVALLELAVSLPQSTPYLVRALVRSAGGGAHGA